MDNEDNEKELGLLLSKGEKYSILVGSGISEAYPSKLPTKKDMIKSLLNCFALSDYAPQLCETKGIELEYLIGCINKFFRRFNIFNYFESVTDYNAIHLFLAQMIVARYSVITSNLDYLIEYALFDLLPLTDRQLITPIISEEDYNQVLNNQVLNYNDSPRKRTYPLYKIRGSEKNIVNGRNTMNSMNTISHISDERHESYLYTKDFSFNTVSQVINGSNLIVIGYSSDFESRINNFLERIDHVGSIIWIEHIANEAVFWKRVDDDLDISDIYPNLSTTVDFLKSISHKKEIPIYLVVSNTGAFLEKYCEPVFFIEGKNKQIMSNIKSNTADFQLCLKNFRSIFNQDQFISQQKRFSCVLPQIFGNYALSLQISRKLKDGCNTEELLFFLKYDVLSNLRTHNWKAAIKSAEKGLKISAQNLKRNNRYGSEKKREWIEKCREFHYLVSLAYLNSGEFSKALKSSQILIQYFPLPLPYFVSGWAYCELGDYNSSISTFRALLEHFERYSQFDGQINVLNAIGNVYKKMSQNALAIEFLEKSLLISQRLGRIDFQINNLLELEEVYKIYGEIEKSCKCRDLVSQLEKLKRIKISNRGEL